MRWPYVSLNENVTPKTLDFDSTMTDLYQFVFSSIAEADIASSDGGRRLHTRMAALTVCSFRALGINGSCINN